MRRLASAFSFLVLFLFCNLTLAQITGPETINFSTADNTNLGSTASDGEGGSTDISGVQIDIVAIDASGTATGVDLIYNVTDFGFGATGEEGISVSNDPATTSWRGISIKSNDGSEFDFNGFESWEFAGAGAVTLNIRGYKNGVATGSSALSLTTGNVDRKEHPASDFPDADFGDVDEVRIIAATAYFGTFDVFLFGAVVSPNAAPTFTSFSGPVETTNEDTGVEITFAELTAVGDEADADGTVNSFVVEAVSSGTLTINGGPFIAGFNNEITAAAPATWTPASSATGTLNAFTVKAKDNSGDLSSTAVQATVTVSPNATAPTVVTSSAGTITASGATLNGDVTSNGGDAITERGFVYAKTTTDASPTLAEVNGSTIIKISVSGTTGAYNQSLTTLTSNTGYSFVSYATNSQGTTEGSIETFTTSNPAVSFNTTSSTGLESVNSATLQVDLSVASSTSITVDYTITGTATGSGTDYTLADGTLTISAGNTSGNITIVGINDDALDELDETVIVTLSSPTNATLGSNTAHTYTITDNDDAPTISFATTSSNGLESVTTANLAVNLSAASSKDITVAYAVTGTATGSGTDYTLVDGSLTISAGATTGNIKIAGINDDALDELDETVIVTLSSPTNATLGSNTAHTYTITDNDISPPVFTSNAITEVHAGDDYFYEITMASDAGANAVITASEIPDWLNLKAPGIALSRVSTLAGTGVKGSIDGANISSNYFLPSFASPAGLVTDPVGNMFIADSESNKIRKVTPEGVVSTFVGSGRRVSEDGIGTESSFFSPSGIVIDASGVIYVTELGSDKVRKVTPEGVVSTFAGSGNAGSADGIATEASFKGPDGIVVDADGNVFVADSQNHKIRKISPQGVVSTFAGTGEVGAEDGASQQASFNNPIGLALDGSGNIFVADAQNHKIRKISPNGEVSTFAGSGTKGNVDGIGSSASFDTPAGLVLDASGVLYVTDALNHKIRRITQEGLVSTLAGTGNEGDVDSADGAASFNLPYGITVDASGNVLVSEFGNHKIRKITISVSNKYTLSGKSPSQRGDHIVKLVADNGSSSTTEQNFTLSVQNEAPAFTSTAVTEVNSGADYNYEITTNDANEDGVSLLAPTLPDWLNLYAPGVTISSFVGSGSAGSMDGIGTAASFNSTLDGATDNLGNIYVTDKENNLIRKVTREGVVTIFAGSGVVGSQDGTGTTASFNAPGSIAVDVSGNIYVSDNNNVLIRKITPFGVVTTLAGSGDSGRENGMGNEASFSDISALAVDLQGNVYAAERNNYLIRKITPAGLVTTFAGSGEIGSENGNGTNASFNGPSGVAVDVDGNVYVTDAGNRKIRKITPEGVVTDFAGSGVLGLRNFKDGIGTSATFVRPSGLIIDNSGNLYTSDFNLIRRITPDGVVTTLAGVVDSQFGDEVEADVSFRNLNSLAIDASGSLYTFEIGSHKIRKVEINTSTNYALRGRSPEDSGVYEVVLKADDGNGGTAEQSFTITIQKDKPLVVSNAVTSLSASSATLNGEVTSDGGATITERGFVYAKTADDPTPTVEETVNNTLVTKIIVEGTTGIYENVLSGLLGNTSYSFIAYAINELGTSEGNVISFTTLNNVPTDITLGASSIDENNEINQKIGDLSTADADSDDTHTYTLVSGTGDTDNSKFSIDANGLLARESFNHEANGNLSIRLQTVDANGGTFQKELNITVNNVNEEPIALALSNNAIDESDESNVLVGSLSSMDPDEDETFSFSLVTGDGDANNLLFTITNDNELRTQAATDFEENATLSIRVRVTDSGGLTFDQVLTITINNIVQEENKFSNPATAKNKAKNIFTPNGDGVNDAWVIEDILDNPINEVKVYSQAGKLIFSQRNYENDWDGTFDGEPIPPGTYYYEINVYNGESIIRGFLTIIRNN